jgi:amino acid permease
MSDQHDIDEIYRTHRNNINEIYRKYAEDTKKIRADHMRSVRNIHIGIAVALIIVFGLRAAAAYWSW